MLEDIGLVCAPTVLSSVRAGKVPSDSGSSGDEGDIGEINNA